MFIYLHMIKIFFILLLSFLASLLSFTETVNDNLVINYGLNLK